MTAGNGRLLLLVGPSCAGKSTLAKALQAASSSPFLSASLDGLFASVPDRWGGQGERASEGFHYEWLSGAPDTRGAVRRIAYGDVGWRMLRAMHRAAAAQAKVGIDVVVDDMLLDEQVLADWREALTDTPTLLVRLTAPLDELLRREQARSVHQTLGLAAGHFELHEGVEADLLIDTSKTAPEEAAQRILRAAFPSEGHGALHRPASANPIRGRTPIRP